MLIQIRLKDGYSLRAIARELTCSPTTISNEIKRGSTLLYKAPKDGIKPPGGRRSTKRTERPPAIITATLMRRLSSSILKISSFPQGGPLMSAWAMLS